MPGLDGTGPLGQGPRTGGGRGWCPPQPSAQPSQGAVIYGVGRGGRPYGGGRGRVFGGGRGAGQPFGWAQRLVANPPVAATAPPSPNLWERLDALARENEELRARVAKLEEQQREA